MYWVLQWLGPGLVTQLLQPLLNPNLAMHVLQLVTNDQAPFFKQQVRSLEEVGITSEIRSPEGAHSSTESRSIAAYGRMVSQTLRESTHSYDLIHANYGLTAPAALAQRRLPIVLSLWGSDLLGSMGPLCRFCATKVDEVIVMTPTMADSLTVPSHIIPHGIDTAVFRPMSKRQAQLEVGWGPDEKHILFPYHPSRTIKDFPTATGVTAAVREQLDMDITLHTLLDVPHDQMPYYYNAADVVLITSKREGSPNAVREALACDRPVVATDVGDIALHLDQVESSRVCQSRSELIDGVVDALTEESTVPRSGSTPSKSGREQAKTHSAEKMAQEIKAVYQRACS